MLELPAEWIADNGALSHRKPPIGRRVVTATATATRPWFTSQNTPMPAQAPAMPEPSAVEVAAPSAVPAANCATLYSSFNRGWRRTDCATSTPAATATIGHAPPATAKPAPIAPSVSENVQRCRPNWRSTTATSLIVTTMASTGTAHHVGLPHPAVTAAVSDSSTAVPPSARTRDSGLTG